ncbi:MAG: phosphatidylserine decarboxylase, partial [Clostridia bacterium]
METSLKTRDGTIIEKNKDQEKTLKFLYETFLGRVLLLVLTRRFVSKLCGAYMDSRFSRAKIKKFVAESKIDMSEYEKSEYFSYNEFFTRKINPQCRPICYDENVLIAPCDSKVSAYKINSDSIFFIKNTPYTVETLLQNKTLADEYNNGMCFIFRLCVEDYHRYCYFDDGTEIENKFIKGVLHTVNPIALERHNIYKTNCREYTILKTKNFDKAVQIEVGAMMVGKIKNRHLPGTFVRGTEKGWFEFGGST